MWKKLKKLWREVEVGHARGTYTDIYEDGGMSLKEYLKRMRELDEEVKEIRK